MENRVHGPIKRHEGATDKLAIVKEDAHSDGCGTGRSQGHRGWWNTVGCGGCGGIGWMSSREGCQGSGGEAKRGRGGEETGQREWEGEGVGAHWWLRAPRRVYQRAAGRRGGSRHLAGSWGRRCQLGRGPLVQWVVPCGEERRRGGERLPNTVVGADPGANHCDDNRQRCSLRRHGRSAATSRMARDLAQGLGFLPNEPDGPRLEA